MAKSQTPKQKSNPKVLGISRKDVISGILVLVIGTGIIGIVSSLWGLQGRVSTLEAHVDDLRDIILRKVVTETITVTYTTTGATPPQFRDTRSSQF
jgi:hypothetical protein